MSLTLLVYEGMVCYVGVGLVVKSARKKTGIVNKTERMINESQRKFKDVYADLITKLIDVDGWHKLSTA